MEKSARRHTMTEQNLLKYQVVVLLLFLRLVGPMLQSWLEKMEYRIM